MYFEGWKANIRKDYKQFIWHGYPSNPLPKVNKMALMALARRKKKIPPELKEMSQMSSLYPAFCHEDQYV